MLWSVESTAYPVMKNQKAVQLVKSSNKIVSSKSAATPSAESGEVVKFNEAGMPQLEVWLEDETIWLTQKQMAELFGCVPQNITYHLREIFKIGELAEAATCKEFLQVQIGQQAGTLEKIVQRLLARRICRGSFAAVFACLKRHFHAAKIFYDLRLDLRFVCYNGCELGDGH